MLASDGDGDIQIGVMQTSLFPGESIFEQLLPLGILIESRDMHFKAGEQVKPAVRSNNNGCFRSGR